MTKKATVRQLPPAPPAGVPMTLDEINAYRTPKGGWDKQGLAVLGVTWPPREGWLQDLMTVGPPGPILSQSAVRGALDPHELLRKVVLAVVEAGHASDLYEFPDVLAYFGAATPDDPEAHHRERTFKVGEMNPLE